MFPLILYVLAVAAVASANECAHVTCDKSHIHFYEERECVPLTPEGECCPRSFNCPSASTSPDKCHVRGNSYDIGTTITSEQVGDKCIAECKCMQDAEDSTKARLVCVRVICPEDLGVIPPEDCPYTYSHDKCCNTGITCDNATDAAEFTCQRNDLAHIGEKFYLDDHPCHVCICMEGFDGTVKEPWCRAVNCGLERKDQEGCAPVYYPGGCCPVEWHCPKDVESMGMIGSSVTPPPPDAPECVFGTHNVSLYEKLIWDGSCIECKCSMPPHLSCMRKENCST